MTYSICSVFPANKYVSKIAKLAQFEGGKNYGKLKCSCLPFLHFDQVMSWMVLIEIHVLDGINRNEVNIITFWK